ncbi:hypothetical protein J6590_099426 [Homalodisca vitripennis]|nr:hypothetical protein J6590_099426 [Homalodisca vitripennis]
MAYRSSVSELRNKQRQASFLVGNCNSLRLFRFAILASNKALSRLILPILFASPCIMGKTKEKKAENFVLFIQSALILWQRWSRLEENRINVGKDLGIDITVGKRRDPGETDAIQEKVPSLSNREDAILGQKRQHS